MNILTPIKPLQFPLYIVCVVSNPERYSSRYRNYWTFQKHVQDSGAVLLTVELAHGEREFEITETGNQFHVQLRTRSQLWHKENLINIGLRRLPHEWRYAGFLDADMINTRPDWVQETLHQLQHYAFVQLFSSYSDLSPDWSCGRSLPSFMKLYSQGFPSAGYSKGQLWGAPGGGWAFRRDEYEKVGSLLETCILGSGDWHMAIALTQKSNNHQDLRVGTVGYKRSIDEWVKKAALIKKNVGFIHNHALHLWHGPRDNRGYQTRTDILKKHAYDPYTDIKHDAYGVLAFTGNKPDFEEDIRQYFRSRNEDA